jgi:hypothetical protein
MRRHHGRSLREVGRVRIGDGGGTAQVSDSIRDAHPLAKCHDPNFALEEVDVELKKHVACDFLFYGRDVLETFDI